MDWLDLLPPELRSRAIDLEPLVGVLEHALHLGDALEALGHIQAADWVVLGGDFYWQEAGGAWIASDPPWALTRMADEPDDGRISRSITTARHEINRKAAATPESEIVVVLVCRPVGWRAEQPDR